MRFKKFGFALLVLLACASIVQAEGNEGGAATNEGKSVSGKIESVTTTNFSMELAGHGHRRRRRIKSVLVHYNPEKVTITVDGVAVQSLDVAATGKYVSVTGVVTNSILEATDITVTTEAPAAPSKGKSATPK